MGRVPKVFSDLNLNGPTPVRVQPKLGEWGPVEVPTTKSKKRARFIAPIAFVIAGLACFLLGYWVWHMMTGLVGFGLDKK